MNGYRMYTLFFGTDIVFLVDWTLFEYLLTQPLGYSFSFNLFPRRLSSLLRMAEASEKRRIWRVLSLARILEDWVLSIAWPKSKIYLPIELLGSLLHQEQGVFGYVQTLNLSIPIVMSVSKILQVLKDCQLMALIYICVRIWNSSVDICRFEKQTNCKIPCAWYFVQSRQLLYIEIKINVWMSLYKL